jgi:hypothetical protein
MWGCGDVEIWGCGDDNFVLLGIKTLLLNYLGKMKPKSQSQNCGH